MSTLPLTELEAVNTMLEVIGEAPVNTLEISGVTEVSIARSILNATSRNFQARGWSFNTEKDYPLVLDEFGQVNLPTNTLQVDATDRSLDVVQRGSKLYDKANHTYIFTEAPKAEITFFLPFEELPHPVKAYLTIAAGRDFQRKVVGSDSLNGFTQEDEMKALVAVSEYEADTEDYSIFYSYSVARPILRNQNPKAIGG